MTDDESKNNRNSDKFRLSMLTGIFATPMAYADDSETETEQELKQSNVGSGRSTNENCGSNSIEAIAITLCPGADIDIGTD